MAIIIGALVPGIGSNRATLAFRAGFRKPCREILPIDQNSLFG
jgi:hypothetical protein